MTTLAPLHGERTPSAQRPPRRRWPYLLAVGLLLVLGGGAYVVFRTSVLGLRQVDVAAQSCRPEASCGPVTPGVRKAVQSAVGVPAGTPLIGLGLAAIRSRVLAVPQIASASVTRHWPTGLLISVIQRVPAALTSANGALWLLDAGGTPYLRVPAGQVPGGLLTLELATPGPKDPPTLAALSVVTGFDHATRAIVGSVSARSPYTVTLNLRDGRAVLWGSPQDNAKKMQVLSAVLAQPGKFYDISDPEYVTVRP